MSADFEKSAQEAIVAAKERCAGGPAATASIVCPLISMAARSSADPHDAVVAAVRGAIKGVLLNGHSVPDCSIKVIESLPDISLMMKVGPENLMSWVMEGIAGAMPLAGPDARDAIHAKIEENWMGASVIFDGFCEAAAKNQN